MNLVKAFAFLFIVFKSRNGYIMVVWMWWHDYFITPHQDSKDETKTRVSICLYWFSFLIMYWLWERERKREVSHLTPHKMRFFDQINQVELILKTKNSIYCIFVFIIYLLFKSPRISNNADIPRSSALIAQLLFVVLIKAQQHPKLSQKAKKKKKKKESTFLMYFVLG